jgi:hypothetical protein
MRQRVSDARTTRPYDASSLAPSTSCFRESADGYVACMTLLVKPFDNAYPGVPRLRWGLPLAGVVAATWQVVVLARALKHGRRLVRRAQRFETCPPRFRGSATGLHPSAASYRHCFEELKRRAPLVTLLTRRPPFAIAAPATGRGRTSSQNALAGPARATARGQWAGATKTWPMTAGTLCAPVRW